MTFVLTVFGLNKDIVTLCVLVVQFEFLGKWSLHEFELFLGNSESSTVSMSLHLR